MSLFGLGKRGEQLAKGLVDLIDKPASAKEYIQQGTNPDFLIKQGLLAPEQINNIRAVQGAQNRYLKHSIQSPEFMMREMGFQNNPTVTSQVPRPPRNIIMPEDLEGMVLKSHLGDRTVTDKTIESIGGVDLPVPVQSRGGVGYGSSPLTPEGNYWGSNLGAATSLQNAAEGLEEMLDKPVAGVYSAMGRDGNFFNQAFADALQQQVDAKDLPQEAIDHFDNSMRTLHGKKDWVGLRHPDARKQLLGTDGYPHKGAGNLRSAYVMQMDKAAYKNQGFPLLQPLMNELIEPELANVNVGDSGFIMGQIGKDFGLSPNANHPSYTTGIMGREIGGTPVSLPSRIMYPDAYKILDQSLTKAGEKYTAAQMINALAVRHDMYQIATPEWVDRASEWIRKNPKGTANALLVAVGTPIALGSSEKAEAAPSMLKSIALNAMSEVTRKTPTSYTGWKKALNKAGVKDDELKQMGFKREFEYRQRSQDITRKEVEDFLAENQYNIREETLGQRKEFGEVVFNPELRTYDAVMPDSRDDELFHTREFAERYVANNPTTINDAKYAPYTLTGGDNVNYREILLLDGVEADKYEGLTKQITKLENEIAKGIGKPEGYLARDAIVDLDEGSKFYEPHKRLTELRKERNDLAQPFIHRHYDDKENILTHLRVADRDLEDGSSTLMVEEIQSDLHQRGQEVGYAKAQDLKGVEDQLEQVNQAISGLKARTGKDIDAEFDRLLDIRDRLKAKRLSTMKAVPEMPFKSNDKSSWYDVAFKRSLIEAAEGDYDSISFSTGKQQVNRYGESAEGGVKTFYDKTLPNHINKWAKQYGVKLQRKPIKVGEYEYSVDSYDDGTYYVRNDEGTTIEDFDSYSDALEYVRNNTDIDDVYTLKIPEKMRDDIRKKGMPLFAQTGLTIGGATAASGLLSPKAQANEARTQGLLQNMASRRDIAERAGAVPDLTAGLLEQTGRDIINFGAGVINPDYGDIAEGGMFPVTEKGEAALTKAGEVFMDKVAPTLVKVGRGLLDDQPMFGGTLREQLGMVRDQYNKLPEGVREEVTPRLGYAGLLALTLSPAAQPVKKAIKKRKKTKQE